jgi:hypothetical protein
MAIFTFDPLKFDEVIEKRKQEQATACGKTQILGEWCNTKNGRIVRLIKDGNLVGILLVFRMRSDLGTLEIFPITDANDLIYLE